MISLFVFKSDNNLWPIIGDYERVKRYYDFLVLGSSAADIEVYHICCFDGNSRPIDKDIVRMEFDHE